MNLPAEHDPEHREVSALLPWYVNSTLAEGACRRVEAHISCCRVCRDDLVLERLIFEKIDSEVAIDHMPAISLKRLRSRLDAAQLSPPAAPAPEPVSAVPWRGLLAASVILVALGASLLTGRWLQLRAPVAPTDYRTVTSPAPRPREEVIRVVFAPTITLQEMQSILDEAGMRIVSGPTEAGVYSLAANSAQPVRASLALLRRHATVRFAEAAGPESAVP